MNQTPTRLELRLPCADPALIASLRLHTHLAQGRRSAALGDVRSKSSKTSRLRSRLFTGSTEDRAVDSSLLGALVWDRKALKACLQSKKPHISSIHQSRGYTCFRRRQKKNWKLNRALAPLVIKEYSSIVGVEKDLRELQDLALEINQRLEAAGDRAMGDAPSLKKLKEAVYEVDDVVDEFQLKAEKYEADGDCGFVSKYLHTKPKSFIFQCQAAKKIKKIKKMFDVLVKQKSILNSVVGNDPVSHMAPFSLLKLG
ncbi:uncharacterized protein [Miscanthus floridulus]|uniref:uncharacterized protein n=1 Tax=Miscanthus floridulus TaxID=154761 RepID=UPI003457B715